MLTAFLIVVSFIYTALVFEFGRKDGRLSLYREFEELAEREKKPLSETDKVWIKDHEEAKNIWHWGYKPIPGVDLKYYGLQFWGFQIGRWSRGKMWYVI